MTDNQQINEQSLCLKQAYDNVSTVEFNGKSGSSEVVEKSDQYEDHLTISKLIKNLSFLIKHLMM